jgi:UDP-glucose 4-epimerase
LNSAVKRRRFVIPYSSVIRWNTPSLPVRFSRTTSEILTEEFANQNVILTGHQSIRYDELFTMIREIVGLDVEIDLKEPPDGRLHGHYHLTPYAFRPKVGKKFVSHYYSDLGQGLLDCLDEIYQAEKAGEKDET